MREGARIAVHCAYDLCCAQGRRLVLDHGGQGEIVLRIGDDHPAHKLPRMGPVFRGASERFRDDVLYSADAAAVLCGDRALEAECAACGHWSCVPGSAFLACVWEFEGIEMVGKYKVITLCGSTRFKDAFLAEQKRLTLEGNIVISVGLFGHSGDNEVWEGMSEDTLTRTKEMLDDMHKRKIDMADEIFVINVGGYIGSSTRSEIEYAEATGKTVRYLES